jgi:hypothetical protein
VAHAHDALEGVAYFTLLRAGAGLSARLYPGGWAEWAADGSLPADAATYPDRAPQAAAAKPSAAGAFPWLTFFAGVALASIVAAGSYYLGRRGGRNA